MNRALSVLDLFSGIGGFSLGFERAGMRTVAFCERDAYCRAVLAKRWPAVRCYDDVRNLTAVRLHADGIERPDVICGGFPCQDISVAGKGAGIDGEQSGLWREFARLVSELRPRYIVVENVSALLGRGIGRILGELAALGFDAEWHCIPANAIGAPHRRDRVWLVAMAHADGVRRQFERQQEHAQQQGALRAQSDGCRSPGSGQRAIDSNAHSSGSSHRILRRWTHVAGPEQARPWAVEPNVGRMAHGIPCRVDRIRALGNSLVPQIAQVIGNAIARHALAKAD